MQAADKSKPRFHKRTIQSLIKKLMSEDGVVRNNARLELVKIGESTIDFLAELVNNSNDRVRWEAIKAMGEIKSPSTIPFLVDALEDEVSSVRWLAAEGLIALKNEGIRAILDALIERKESYLLRQGAHHVLHDLNKKLQDNKIAELISLLEHPEEYVRIPMMAKQILDHRIAGHHLEDSEHFKK
jgi:hypothetical protein